MPLLRSERLSSAPGVTFGCARVAEAQAASRLSSHGSKLVLASRANYGGTVRNSMKHSMKEKLKDLLDFCCLMVCVSGRAFEKPWSALHKTSSLASDPGHVGHLATALFRALVWAVAWAV